MHNDWSEEKKKEAANSDEKLPLELILEEYSQHSRENPQDKAYSKKDSATEAVETLSEENKENSYAEDSFDVEENTDAEEENTIVNRQKEEEKSPVQSPIILEKKGHMKHSPPPKYLRSTPPKRQKATVLPKIDETEENSIPEPINSSNNEALASQARADRASSKAYSHAPIATRSRRAASTAGLDLSEEYRSKGKFRQSLQLARKQHPYIFERPLTIRDEEAYFLLDKIRSVPLYKMQDLSIEMNSEETKFLFHALLLETDSQIIKAIQHIAVQRASWSLYTIGWSTLQRNFPNRVVQQTLELVYNTLESDPSRAEVRPSYMRNAIGDLVNLSKSDSGFISDMVRHMNQAYNVSPDEGIESLLSDFQILTESPLGGAVFGEFFRRADFPVLYYKKEILSQAMPFMHPALAAEVVSRVVASRDPIEGDKKYLYKQIADIFLHKEANHPMWPYMSADLQRAYRRWYIDDRLDNQTMMYPSKKQFLLTYLEDIEDVAMLSADLMAIRFDQFILVDDRKRGDKVIFYDNNTVKDLIMKGLDEKDLGSSSIPARDVKDAVAAKRLQGVVKLSFSQGELQYSRQFMDLLLGHSKQKRENVLRNWFR